MNAALRDFEATLREHDFPPQVVIETTAFCNFRCVHCNHKELRRAKGTMDEALFRKAVAEIAREAPETEVWPTFYGEAFVLGERLFAWLRLAANAGLRNLVLNSNGSLLDRKDWIDQLLSCGLKRFIVSLDGLSPAVFESIRVGGRRDAIYAAVEKLLERRRQLGLVYPVIQCQFSEMEQNRHEVEAFRAYWLERGAEVKVRRMLSWTASGSVVAPGLDYHAETRIACAWANHTLAIHHNGDVVACAVDYEGRFVAGNLRTRPLGELWHGPLRQLRENHRAHRWSALPEVCRGCPDWQAVGACYAGPADAAQPYARPFWHK